jgi:hypothetical protein
MMQLWNKNIYIINFFEIVITLIWKYLKEINDSQWDASRKILKATTIGSPFAPKSTFTQRINIHLNLYECLVLRMLMDR